MLVIMINVNQNGDSIMHWGETDTLHKTFGIISKEQHVEILKHNLKTLITMFKLVVSSVQIGQNVSKLLRERIPIC